ncbi:beta-glucuronidase [Tessaracoccus sp. MC1756]|uniref:beta-glucuronidase n=1 Tax=Tessaracoccus sp. MC1756 TaxID=2760311 RepID=UPI001600A1EB|nr:beta-glucuronidase [Tessaracoccus sp. MC1756]MBB1508291.1 beta-glucuronidase [Tessaracoccus sp. MC1756]
MLGARTSLSRTITSLDGVWDFSVDTQNSGIEQRWFAGPLEQPRPMPVPASYNDITTESAVRDHVGWVWYQRTVTVPLLADGERLFLRFGSASHEARVWVNDDEVASHVGGYLPFEADVTDLAGRQFRLTVAVDNRLSWQSIPPGFVSVDEVGNATQYYFHDFYNYAGLHRSVSLCTRPQLAVTDVTITTRIDGRAGVVDYAVEVADATQGPAEAATTQVSVRVLDAAGVEVGSAAGAAGRVRVEDAELWEPGRGYLYTLEVTAGRDVYPQPFGIRTVEVKDSQFLINDRPFYFRGYGRHEDNLVRGKGHDDALMVHDFELMTWQGANSFRTSHYPYAEEVMDHADRMGFVVIDETAAVGMNQGLSGGIFGDGKPRSTFSPETINDETRRVHEAHIRELIARDKNHPSVVLWSIANEPETWSDASRAYFEPLVAATRDADPSRPVGYVNVQLSTPDKEKVADLYDVVMLNRYYGWYWDNGNLELAEKHLREELDGWLTLAPGKPILFTEYGPDTLNGLRDFHRRPWSEEYQVDMLAMFHRVFDDYPEVVGEQMWNFADFQTTPGIMRVGGNKKGMFTRDRLPKSAAYDVRKRWHQLRSEQGN